MMVSSKDLLRARRIAMRTRAASACKTCRALKTRCNDYRPCKRCKRSGHACMESSKSARQKPYDQLRQAGHLSTTKPLVTARLNAIQVAGAPNALENPDLESTVLISSIANSNPRSRQERLCAFYEVGYTTSSIDFPGVQRNQPIIALVKPADPQESSLVQCTALMLSASLASPVRDFPLPPMILPSFAFPCPAGMNGIHRPIALHRRGPDFS